MFEIDDQRDPLEMLAAEFMERQRRGETPSVAEYVAKYPELAPDIEELFPTIAVMERLKAHKEHGSGARASLGGVRLERLGDFRILGEIGRGGMGIVYEAFQESLGRHVAVKVLPRQTLLAPQQLRRFQREAQTAARLHHTNIVPVFGVGEHDGFHYIVMQLIPGAGLDDVIKFLGKVGAGAVPGQAGPDVRAGKAGEGRKSEVSRVARALVDGAAGAGHGFAASSEVRADGSADRKADFQSAEEQQGDWKSPLRHAPPAAPTEEFACNGDTKANGHSTAPAEAQTPISTTEEPWRFGPAYWRSVAAIGQQVADGLQYAHAHRTLHRDIKPANLLLDQQGAAWITDFGLAKAMEQDHVTQTGAMVGTLRYMAPEQFSGQSDARSDVYSLGLTLYELLTLRPAFDDASRSGLIAKITHGEPPRPRKLDPAIPRDLETIVLKAMARDPQDRYRTAGELAADLECFLEDRPIRARRTSAAERLWRWARRNRAVASLAACTLLLLVAVAVVAGAASVRLARANADERRANAEEKAQRKNAEEITALSLDALDRIFRQFAPDRTAPASASLQVGDADEPITVPVQPVLSKEAAAMLEHMLKFYDRLADQRGDDAKLRRKVAEANRRVGDIRQRLGHYDLSKAAYQRAIELYTPLADASGPDADLRAEIARIHNELGNVCRATDRPEEAMACYRNALALLRTDGDGPSPSPRQRYELARTWYFLGKGPNVPPGPRPAHGGPGGPRVGPHGGGHRGPPGFVFDPRGPRPRGVREGQPTPQMAFVTIADRPGAEGFEKAAALWQGLVADDFDWPPSAPRREGPKPDVRKADSPPGLQAVASKSPPAAGASSENEIARQKAIEILERLVGDDPAVPDYRHLLARCYRELPPPLRRDGKPATDNLNKAAQILTKLVEEHKDIADYRYDLSETYAMLGEQRAVSEGPGWAGQRGTPKLLDEALKLSEELVAEHPNIPEYAVSQVNIRLRLDHAVRGGDPTRAEANLRKALAVQSALVERSPQAASYKFWRGVIQESLGGLLQEHNRLAEAKTALQDCIASFRDCLRNDGKPSPIPGILAHNYTSLADVLRRLGEDEAAAEATRQARELATKGPAAGPP